MPRARLRTGRPRRHTTFAEPDAFAGSPTLAVALTLWVAWRRGIGASRNSIYNQAQYIKGWLKGCGGAERRPHEVTEVDVGMYINDSSKAKASSRRIRLSAITSFLDYCSIKGWMAGNPAKLVRVDMSQLSHEQKEKKPPPSPFTNDEVRVLISNMRNRSQSEGFTLRQRIEAVWWEFAVVMGRYTGLRLGDIAEMEMTCMVRQNEEDYLVVWTDKRDKRVQLPTNEQLRDTWGHALGWHHHIVRHETGHSDYVFPAHARTNRLPRARGNLSKGFVRLGKSLFGADWGKTFHGLRHTYVQDAINQGHTLEHIAVLVGHSDTATTEGYAGAFGRRRILR